uniref:GCS light chain n=1 Tax=Syphacia muris TaxID=451379 RepID=A0A0N5AI37_9BILA
MTNWNYRQISDCVDTALSRLDFVFYFFICFDDEDGFWLNNALTLWKNIEDLVYSGKVISLGVADLGFSRVKMLNEAVVRVRPSIYHYNVGDCCEVELRNYAAEHNIYLLTHNDPNLSKLKGKVGEKIRSFLGDDQLFELGWFARYTVWDQSRSIVRSKGYILQFQKNH